MPRATDSAGADPELKTKTLQYWAQGGLVKEGESVAAASMLPFTAVSAPRPTETAPSLESHIRFSGNLRAPLKMMKWW